MNADLFRKMVTGIKPYEEVLMAMAAGLIVAALTSRKYAFGVGVGMLIVIAYARLEDAAQADPGPPVRLAETSAP